ncbi:M16 family metallopeptidase [Sphingomonas bacterium]|uniref:M16 family metallopeptidase n=1 Tax=Sphingomonas bacterium TaxID=1895847 RepID=UPI001C2DDFA5|nr:M16 family metallopeptidase [Sphingomonas bacterium]
MDLRFASISVFAFASIQAPATADAQSAQASIAPTVVVPRPAASWPTIGSDVPLDPAWHTGTLANGVRYAVRRGKQPPGTISVRVRMDVGALMERDEQQGWSHLVEHMVFRGTAHYPDGEGVRVWQRLGASFGSDTNAFTALRSTTYALDLPRADAASYSQALSVLSDMLTSATIDPKLLTTERAVVMAERAQRMPPLVRKMRETTQPLFFAGTKSATRDIAGNDATLNGASASALRAYYKAWYRPSRAVVVVVGDADPALLEQGVRTAFGAWTAEGAEPTEPDYGTPRAPATSVATVSDPQLPSQAILALVTPHDDGVYTIARQQRNFVDAVAIGILRRRLDSVAQRGESIILATVGVTRQRHIEDEVIVAITPKPGQWSQALEATYRVLNGALAAPPSQAEVDEQTAKLIQSLSSAVSTEQTLASAAVANGFVGSIDQQGGTAAPIFYLRLFALQRATLTPDVIQSAIKRLLAPDPRLLIASNVPVPVETAAKALASSRAAAADAGVAVREVSLAQLTLAGQPATVTGSDKIADLGIERVHLSNGVEIDLKQTAFEKNRIRVVVTFGHGLLGETTAGASSLWSSAAVTAGGIGPFSADELERLGAGRAILFGFGVGVDRFTFTGASGRRDVESMMKLMAAELTQPQFRAAPLGRLRDAVGVGYQSTFSQPVSVFQRFGAPYLHGGDARFAPLPPLSTVEGLTLPDFRSFWSKRLASGPLRVLIVGDFDRDATVAAVARTIGTLAPRTDDRPPASLVDVKADVPARGPVQLHHEGDPLQAVVAKAYPTIGLLDDVPTSTALDIAARLVETRMIEQFREQQGGTYSPFASHPQSSAMPHYGVFLAGAQLQTGRIDDFTRALNAIIVDLGAHGPTPDALARARTVASSASERALSDNGYWMNVLTGDLDDPRYLAFTKAAVSRWTDVTPATVKAAVARYLRPERGFAIEVLPVAPTVTK